MYVKRHPDLQAAASIISVKKPGRKRPGFFTEM